MHRDAVSSIYIYIPLNDNNIPNKVVYYRFARFGLDFKLNMTLAFNLLQEPLVDLQDSI